MGLSRRMLAGILSAVLALGLCSEGAAAAGSGGEFTLGIYFTADLYGRWCGVDPCTGKTVEANYLKVATAMAGQQGRDDARLLVDVGNSLGEAWATYQMNMERGQTEPVALSLRYAGYDALLPGSCERALTPECRKEFYDSLTDPAGTLSGSSVAVLQAGDGEEREERTAPFLVRSFPVDGRQFRVGLVSLESTLDWRRLRQDQACDLIVAAIPSGMAEEGISELVGRSAGLDLILMNGEGVSGIINLRDFHGRRVPVVRGGGGTLARTEIVVSPDGSFTVGKSEGMELSSRRNDDNLGALLAPYYESYQAYGAQELGVLFGEWDWESDLACVQSDTMDLIHEAQLWAAQAEVSIAAPLTGREFCVRQLLEDRKAAPVGRRSCYAIYPDENDRLLAVRMTGRELKDWLERSAGQYTVGEDGAVAGEAVSQAYGVSYTICLGNPVGERVMNLTYQGKPVTPGQTFRVAVSQRSLAAAQGEGEPYPVLWEAAGEEAFRTVGGSVTWIIGEYIRSLSAEYKQLTPPKARSRWSITAAPSAQALASVTRLAFVERFYDAVGRPSAYLDLGQTFADMDGENPAAAWAVQSGIVQGNGSGQFAPDSPINREQAAIMLLRFDLARNMGPSGAWAVAVPYTDATEISAWASEAVMWNVIREYLPDDEGGNFRPQDPLTVLELEGILERLGS